MRVAYIHLKWLETYLRFPAQLQHASYWLMYQAEAVYVKTVCLGSCAKVVSIVMLHKQ